MKRFLIGLAVVVLLLVGALASVAIPAFAHNLAIQDGLQLTPTARVIKDGFVSVGMLDLQNGSVALIDAGNDKEAKPILAELQRRGLPPEAVSAIFLTHGHGDHVNGCRMFPHAEVYALEAEVPLVEGRAHPNGWLGHLMPLNKGIHVAHAIKDGDIVTLGNRRIQAFAVPGHTSGSAVYLVDGVLYFGDSAGGHKDGKLHPAVAPFSEDPALNEASLRSLANRLRPQASAIKTLEFAHTGPLDLLQPLLDFAAGGSGSV